MDILTFAEISEYPLSPAQRVVLKLIYGIPLDSTGTFDLNQFDPLSGNFQTVTRTEFQYVWDLEKEERFSRPPENGHVVLVGGRRAGKDYLLLLILAYEVFLQLDEPQRKVARDQFLILGQSTSRAEDFLAKFAVFAHRCPLLAERIANEGRTFLYFQRRQDIEKSGPWKGSQRQASASLYVHAQSNLETSLRGQTCRMAILLEFGLFPKARAEAVRKTLEDCSRTLNGRIFAFSSPPTLDETSDLENVFDDPSWLRIQVPSWEMCPQIEASFLRRELARNPQEFYAEWGGQFLETLQLRVPRRFLHPDSAKELQAYIMATVLRADPEEMP